MKNPKNGATRGIRILNLCIHAQALFSKLLISLQSSFLVLIGKH